MKTTTVATAVVACMLATLRRRLRRYPRRSGLMSGIGMLGFVGNTRLIMKSSTRSKGPCGVATKPTW